MRQLILDIRPDTPPTFENFLPVGNLEVVHALREAAAGRMGEAVIYLWGPAGAGKSHLLRSAFHAARQRGAEAIYVEGQAPMPEDMPELLLVDDVQTLGESDQIALFNLVNAAREGSGTILAAGDAPPARLPLRADLATRLSWGLVYSLAPLSDADKLRAMTERARARGMELPEELTRYLFMHQRRDLPHLLALVDALDAYSMSLKRPVSLPLLRALLEQRGRD